MDVFEPLDWHDGQPRSLRFGDVYFSRHGGLEETAHVFLEGNRLPARFAAMPSGGRFVIGETGFGTGLSFLCAWRLFEATAPGDARLDVVSTEQFPLSVADLRRALDLWPQLAPWSARLLSQYGALARGWHRFDFAPQRVRLTLLVGDARETLPALRAAVDAWFLDGFSPARNPQLWEASLLQTVGALSAPGATVATYSCAGSVRRALAKAGFDVRKAPGFGTKREMLRGERTGGTAARRVRPGRAAVVGAGVAGCAVAAALARRGWQVDLVERHAHIAAESSGNAQGMLYARLSPQHGPLSQLVGCGYQHSLRLLRRLLPCDGLAWSDAPLLQLAFDAQERHRQDSLVQRAWPRDLLHAVDRDAAEALAGVALPAGGIVFPGGGWVHPPTLCAALAATPGVRVRAGTLLQSVRRQADRWLVEVTGQAVEAADVVVLANAADARAIEQAAHLPLRVNRGQVTLLPAPPGAALRAVVCGERYIAPARLGMLTTGATFERSADTAVRDADNAENMEALRALVPALHAAIAARCAEPALLNARAALRCVSPDYLPLAGALLGAERAAHPGLYASLAHGSRGLITAPICGELIADLIDGTPAALPDALVRALEPERFSPRPWSLAPSL